MNCNPNLLEIVKMKQILISEKRHLSLKYWIRFASCILVISVFSSFLTSCSNKSTDLEVIKISIDSTKKNKLNVNIKALVPLETNPDCLIGSISSFKWFDNRFYILDVLHSNALFVFDGKGNFKNKTLKGKGPGEVIDPFAFLINEDDSTILLHDQGAPPTLVYDLNLKYLRSINHPHAYIFNFYHLAGDTFLIYNHYRDKTYTAGKKYHNYQIFTNDFKDNTRIDIPLYGDKIAQSIRQSVSYKNGDVIFSAPFNYNLYRLQGNNAQARYRVDFGKYNISDEQLASLSSDEIWDLMNKGKGIGFFNRFYFTNDFFVLGVYFRNTQYTFFKSQKNGNTFCLNDCFESLVLPECEIWGISDSGTYYGIVEPENLLKFQQETGKYSEIVVKDNDNPYVIILDIKES